MIQSRAVAKDKLGDMPENTVTDRIIKCAIEVDRTLGPGLLESVEEALSIECE